MGTAAILGLIATLVGTAMQGIASYNANNDAQAIMNRAQEQNTADHKKLIDNINQETTNYAAEKRQAAQDEIASELEKQYSSPVSESQAVRSEQQVTQGDVSDDYKKAKEASDKRTQQTIGTLANLMGRVKSANRLRMNEGIRLADMASANDLLAQNAIGRTQASQYDAQRALNSYNGLKMLGQGIGAVGTALSLGAGSGIGAAGNAASNAAASGAVSGANLLGQGTSNALMAGASQAANNPFLNSYAASWLRSFGSAA